MSSLTYANYLMVDELLALQQCRSPGPEHDETLFIVIHQVYELWFKQMLHEGQGLCASLRLQDVPQSMHTLRRMGTILKTMVSQVDVLETMTPLSFSSFRASLKTASGFQSNQFRKLEAMLGQRSEPMRAAAAAGTPADAELAKMMSEPSVYDAFLQLLSARGYAIPLSVLTRDVQQSYEPNAEVQEILIRIYRNDSELTQICERLVDLDEGLQEWRYRHVKMVERTIGVRFGTGGSSGAEYLRRTLFSPLFADLWAIRASF
jgi:tryptophan 2,3-dioxygenase